MDLHGPRKGEESDFSKLHPRFSWMRDCLARAAPPGRLPGYQHLNLAAMEDMLHLINVVDVVRDNGALRFRFRLVGTL